MTETTQSSDRPKYRRFEIIERDGMPPVVPSVEPPVDTPEKIVAECLRTIQIRFDNMHDGRRDVDDPTLMHESIAVQVDAFGLAVVMEVLRRVAPDVAERTAKALWECWDDGSVIGEHVWVWRKELAAGAQLDAGGYLIPRCVSGLSS